MKHTKLPISNRQRGFTLLEVLISVVVLAIGLLGMAGLQALSVRFNDTAYLRTQATQAVDDISDRMRANARAVLAGDYRIQPAISAPPTGAPDCGSSRCTPAQMAQADIEHWASGLGDVLTGAWNIGITCLDADPGDGDPCSQGSIHRVALTWEERVNADEDDDGTKDGLLQRTFATNFRSN